MFIPCMVNFLELESLSGTVQMCSPCSSLQVFGHWGNLSRRLIFSLILAVFSSKQSCLVWWCAYLVSLLSHGSEPLHYCHLIFHTGLQLNHFVSLIWKTVTNKIHIMWVRVCQPSWVHREMWKLPQSNSAHQTSELSMHPNVWPGQLSYEPEIRIINTHPLTSRK